MTAITINLRKQRPADPFERFIEKRLDIPTRPMGTFEVAQLLHAKDYDTDSGAAWVRACVLDAVPDTAIVKNSRRITRAINAIAAADIVRPFLEHTRYRATFVEGVFLASVELQKARTQS